MTLLLFQGISGLYGGGALILDSSGSMIQLPASFLEGSPFETYLVPGIILFVVLGVFPLIVWYGLWRRTSWSWQGAVLVSVALVIWIAMEIVMIGYQSEPPLQLIYGVVGVALLVLTQIPSVRTQLN